MVGKSKKYIAANVAAQWVSLAANITMMTAVTSFSAGLLAGTPPGQEGAADGPGLAITAGQLPFVPYVPRCRQRWDIFHQRL